MLSEFQNSLVSLNNELEKYEFIIKNTSFFLGKVIKGDIVKDKLYVLKYKGTNLGEIGVLGKNSLITKIDTINKRYPFGKKIKTFGPNIKGLGKYMIRYFIEKHIASNKIIIEHPLIEAKGFYEKLVKYLLDNNIVKSVEYIETEDSHFAYEQIILYK